VFEQVVAAAEETLVSNHQRHSLCRQSPLDSVGSGVEQPMAGSLVRAL
jgi:hypothetical protein